MVPVILYPKKRHSGWLQRHVGELTSEQTGAEGLVKAESLSKYAPYR